MLQNQRHPVSDYLTLQNVYASSSFEDRLSETPTFLFHKVTRVLIDFPCLKIIQLYKQLNNLFCVQGRLFFIKESWSSNGDIMGMTPSTWLQKGDDLTMESSHKRDFIVFHLLHQLPRCTRSSQAQTHTQGSSALKSKGEKIGA